MNGRHRPPRILFATTPIAAATLTVACGQDSTVGRGNLTTTFDTINDVVHVTNTGHLPEWQLTQVASIGPKSITETGSPDEFGGVRSVALGPADALYIADLVNHEVRVFGLDGAHRRTFGREGEGPGEFSGLHSITWVGDRLLALDYVIGRVTEFSAEGDVLGQRRMRGRIGGSPLRFRFFPVGPDEAYAMTYVVSETRRGLMFAGHDSRGETGDTLPLLRSEQPSGIECEYNEGWVSSFDIPFAPSLVQHPGPGGTMYVAMSDDYRIAVTRGSDTLRVIGRTLAAEPISDMEWETGNQELREFIAETPGPAAPSGRTRSPSSGAFTSLPTAGCGSRCSAPPATAGSYSTPRGGSSVPSRSALARRTPPRPSAPSTSSRSARTASTSTTSTSGASTAAGRESAGNPDPPGRSPGPRPSRRVNAPPPPDVSLLENPTRRTRTGSAMLSERDILDLAERAGKGSREALGRLADALRPLICRWALVMTGDPHDAEDVAQRVLMKMMESIEGFDGRSRVTTWVYRITRNAGLDHQRKRKRDRRLADKAEWLARAEPPRMEDPLDDIEMERTLRLIRTLLRELPMRQREVFDLVDLQGLEPKEAAELLGMNANTVRVHLLRARRRMRSEMLAAGFEYPNTGE